MSGILGIWKTQAPYPWQAMLSSLAETGQDSQGEWHDAAVGIRLGRVQRYDTPESRLESPVVQAEGCALVWEGRLDDRASLLAGRTGVTDAQLLIESYRRWGVDCLQHLVGEYAFILWDAAADRLVVGCDKVGGRTIAYHWDGETLLLSSRALALLLHPQVSPELDELYVAHVLCDLWAQPPGMTPFQSIQRLRPGWALVLEAGRFQQREVAKFAAPDRYAKAEPAEHYYEQFWHLLHQAVQDRLRTCHRVCTTLSGGLDSTTVTVSLLRQLGAIDAFSKVTTVFPEFDEREPIQEFLHMHPQVRWHPVNVDDAWTLSEPWDELPATDDPFSICTLAMHLRMMAQIRQQGFGVVFDGEWGDELFHTSIQDQARGGNWRQVWRLLTTNSRWHSTLWWEFGVPNLPPRWRSPWLRKSARYAHPLPTWIRSSYAQRSEVQTATEQAAQLNLAYDQLSAVTLPSHYSSFVGGTQSYRQITDSQNLQFVSPLQDQRLIDFALQLPPALLADPIHEKVFLRQANQGTLPESVRWRPKDNYFDPPKYAGLGKGTQVLELVKQMKSCAFLGDRIDLEKLESNLLNYRHSYSNSHENKKPIENKTSCNLYAAIEFFIWMEKLSLNAKYKNFMSSTANALN